MPGYEHGHGPEMPPPNQAPLAERLQWTQRADPNLLRALSREQVQASTDRVHQAVVPYINNSGMSFYDGILFIHSTHVAGHEHLLLSPQQAAEPFYQRFRTLGGVVRPQGSQIVTGMYEPLGAASSYAERAQFFQAPLGGQADQTLQRLAQASENLFPLAGQNRLINKGTIYTELSAIQLAFIATHPFFEANGKVSEDMLFVLWDRRPDLAKTIRYPSSDGLRGHDNNAADQREVSILDGIKYIFKEVATRTASILRASKLGKLSLRGVDTYTDLEHAATQARVAGSILLEAYDQALVDYLYQMIHDIESANTRALERNPAIAKLAQNLAHAPKHYRYRDGTVL